jgi:hypothetical protein
MVSREAWHHLAVCTIREHHRTNTAQVLAERLGRTNLVYLRRQLTGEYPASIPDLIGWAIALDDVTVLPQVDSLSELYPPGARPG